MVNLIFHRIIGLAGARDKLKKLFKGKIQEYLTFEQMTLLHMLWQM